MSKRPLQHESRRRELEKIAKQPVPTDDKVAEYQKSQGKPTKKEKSK
jgi:hypothetical protein